MFLSDKWKDYELLDASDGEKLERWGDVILLRPDPQIVWTVSEADKSKLWRAADAGMTEAIPEAAAGRLLKNCRSPGL